MKRLAVLSAIVGMVVVAVLFFAQNGQTKLSGCVLSNVEALAISEWQDCGGVNYVPNEKIEARCETWYVTCVVKGELTVNGETLTGNYKRNKEYPVFVEVKNCVPAQGACCDQNEVGVSIL